MIPLYSSKLPLFFVYSGLDSVMKKTRNPDHANDKLLQRYL